MTRKYRDSALHDIDPTKNTARSGKRLRLPGDSCIRTTNNQTSSQERISESQSKMRMNDEFNELLVFNLNNTQNAYVHAIPAPNLILPDQENMEIFRRIGSQGELSTNDRNTWTLRSHYLCLSPSFYATRYTVHCRRHDSEQGLQQTGWSSDKSRATSFIS